MIAGVYNITCEQGSTFTRTFSIMEPDGETPYDLTGYSARMKIRRDYDSATVLFSATVTNGAITIDALNGEITVDIGAVDTATFARDGVYDLEIFDPSDVDIVYKVVRGRFTLVKEATK